MYQIDWAALIKQLIPAFLQGAVFKNWITVLLTPLMTGYNQFLAFRQSSVYRVSHTGQVISLTDMLNHRFDPLSNRIYLTDFIQEIEYTGKSNETIDTYVPLVSEWNYAQNYVGTIQDYYATTIINVNDDITPLPDSQDILNLVEPYRLAGKVFLVNYISANPQ